MSEAPNNYKQIANNHLIAERLLKQIHTENRVRAENKKRGRRAKYVTAVTSIDSAKSPTTGRTLRKSCAVVAAQLAFGLSTQEVLDDFGGAYGSGRTGTKQWAIERLARNNGWVQLNCRDWDTLRILNSGRRTTDLTKPLRFRPGNLPAGKCLIRINHHIMYVDDGVVNDTFNSIKSGTKSIWDIFFPNVKARREYLNGRRASDEHVVGADPSTLATVPEASKYTGYSKYRLQRLCAEERLQGAHKINGKWMIPLPLVRL